MKKAILTVLLIVSLLTFPACFNQEVKEQKQAKIGAILPLTGQVGIFGQWAKNGMELAVKDVNQEKGTNLTIIYEDSKFDAKKGISAYKKLTTVDEADAVISAMSKVSLPLIPLAEEDNTTLLLQDVTAPHVTEDREHVFRHFIQSDREAETIAHHARENLDIRTTGVLYVNDEAGVAAQKAFKEEFEKAGGQILVTESFSSTSTDYRTQIMKIKDSGAEAIYLFGNGPSWARALKQIRELGFQGKILTNTAMYIPNFRSIAGNATEGVYFTYPPVDSDSESAQEFRSAYRKEYGEEPPLEAYYGWDLIQAYYQALEKNDWNEEGVEEELRKMKEINSSFGEVNITPEGEFMTPVGIGVIEEGKIVELKK